MTPDLPLFDWTILELIEEPHLLKASHPSVPHWAPRGGKVSDAPPTVEEMKDAALQSKCRLVAVRYRVEPETAIVVEFERELPEVEERTEAAPSVSVPEQAELFGSERKRA